MKRRTLLTGAALSAATVPMATLSATAWSQSEAGYQVATTEQNSNRLLIFNREDEWTQDTIQWAWGPASSGWSNLSDVRFRDTASFDQVVLAAASGGNVGIIDRTDDGGSVLWAGTPGGNPHAIERIPNIGAIVSASSDGYLKVYGPTAVSDPSTLAEVQHVDLPGAHGLLWDPSEEVLWGIGDKIVRAYQVTGEYRDVRIKETDTAVELPGLGHDLQPDYSDPNKLLVTDTHGAYEIAIDTLELTRVIEAPLLKAFVRDASGEALWVQGEDNEPRPWSSPTVHFDDDKRTLKDAQFYKARVVTSEFEAS